MARNTQVAADHDTPPVTQILARFIAEHPPHGGSDTADVRGLTAIARPDRTPK